MGPAYGHDLTVLRNPGNPFDAWLNAFAPSNVAVLRGCAYAVACQETDCRVHPGDPAMADQMLTAL